MMELEERQLIIFMYSLGMDNIGVKTFDPSNTRQPNDYVPSEGDKLNTPPLDIAPGGHLGPKDGYDAP